MSRSSRRRGARLDYPYLLIAPIWFGAVHNGLLASAHPLDIGDLLKANLDLIFGDEDARRPPSAR